MPQDFLFDWDKFSVISLGRYRERSIFNNIRNSAISPLSDLIHWAVGQGAKRIGVSLHFHTPPMLDDLDRYGIVIALQRHYASEGIQILHIEHSKIYDNGAEWIIENRIDALLSFATEGHDLTAQLAQRNAPPILHGQYQVSERADGAYELPVPGAIVWNSRTYLYDTAFKHLNAMARRGETGIPELPIGLVVPSKLITPEHLAAPEQRRAGTPLK